MDYLIYSIEDDKDIAHILNEQQNLFRIVLHKKNGMISNQNIF